MRLYTKYWITVLLGSYLLGMLIDPAELVIYLCVIAGIGVLGHLNITRAKQHRCERQG